VHLEISSEATIGFGAHVEIWCATPLCIFGGAIWTSGVQLLVFWAHLEWRKRTSGVGPVDIPWINKEVRAFFSVACWLLAVAYWLLAVVCCLVSIGCINLYLHRHLHLRWHLRWHLNWNLHRNLYRQ
jgi:hypothetical protein